MLSPLLYALYTYDCTSIHPTNTIIKFADDTTIVGLISGGDETAYRDEIHRLTEWSTANNRGSECFKNQRAHHWLPKAQHKPYTIAHQRGLRGEGSGFQILGHKHRWGSFLEHKHFSSGQESTAATLFLKDTEEESAARAVVSVLLSLCHWKCEKLLHLYVVDQQLSGRQESSPVGDQFSTKNLWRFSAFLKGALHCAQPRKGSEHFRGTLPSWTSFVLIIALW